MVNAVLTRCQTPFLKLYLDYEKSAKEGEQLLSAITTTNPQFSAFADVCGQKSMTDDGVG